jgi:hypothetical protein
VGADLLGVSQVPVVGAVANLLVSVLLKLIGVQIEARDTMTDMSRDFRGWRGDVAAADASGRLYSDTSSATDRSSSSVQEVADERLRVLKIVLDGLVKYMIDNVIEPIAKAVANTAIQAGASAAGAAINTQAPGAGGIVSSLISSAGSAGVDIASELITSIAKDAISASLEGVAQLLPSVAPDLTRLLFGGIASAQFFDPITALFSGALGGIATVLTGVSGTFDNGGIANGVGVLPKATIRPERMLSPDQTEAFDRLVAVLERNPAAAGSTTMITAPITVMGGADAGRRVRDELLSMVA